MHSQDQSIPTERDESRRWPSGVPAGPGAHIVVIVHGGQRLTQLLNAEGEVCSWEVADV